MNVIYITSACSQKKFDTEVANIRNAFAFQNQKFHHLLINGLATISDLNIIVVSTYPTDRSRKIKRYEEEVENSVRYIYPSFVNIPIVHRVGKYVNTKSAINNLLTDDTVIVCNVLDYDQCLAAQSIKKKYPQIKLVGIVTDLPNYSSGATFVTSSTLKTVLSSGLKSFYNKSILNYDAYLFLAEPMNNIVNHHSRPFCIIEGFSDINIKNTPNKIEDKYTPKVLLYTGGIHAEYGIKSLVEAFELANIPGWELHIYGDGNYREELTHKSKMNPAVKYLGVKNNKEIVEIQLKATLLVNPRPTNEEYVKYSFPSKTMEYMASGTPLLTTRLPSMPKEYMPYVYFINDESNEGIATSLSQYLLFDPKELHSFGLKAKDFILEEKNNLIQAMKFYKFLKEILI